MPLSDRGMVERMALAVFLPLVSGTVNAVCLLQLGRATSHMTGNVTTLGETLYLGQSEPALAAALLLLCFFLGAFTASLVVEGVSFLRGRYATALFIEAAALGAFGLMTAKPEWAVTFGNIGVTGFVCFAMGLQNALVTRISSAVIRTTHLTGVVTDLGIGAVRVLRHAVQNRRLLLQLKPPVPDDLNWRIFKLHFAILLSFTLGAALGPLCLVELGSVRWLLLPIGILLGLMLFDLTGGFTRHVKEGAKAAQQPEPK